MTAGRTPRIQRKRLLAGAREAKGVAVVIDVYRAFTSAALMMYLGVQKILLVQDPEAALRLKVDKGCMAVGEVDGRKVPGFDLGNSPSDILAAGQALFAGRTVAQRTSAGVVGALAAARHADIVILGSFVTAAATARYVQGLAPETVSLVAMGAGGSTATPEDEACADYLEYLLAGTAYDHAAAMQRIIADESTTKFLRGDQDHFPPTDPIYCLQRDLFDFAIAAIQDGDHLVARRTEVPG